MGVCVGLWQDEKHVSLRTGDRKQNKSERPNHEPTIWKIYLSNKKNGWTLRGVFYLIKCDNIFHPFCGLPPPHFALLRTFPQSLLVWKTENPEGCETKREAWGGVVCDGLGGRSVSGDRHSSGDRHRESTVSRITAHSCGSKSFSKYKYKTKISRKPKTTNSNYKHCQQPANQKPLTKTIPNSAALYEKI